MNKKLFLYIFIATSAILMSSNKKANAQNIAINSTGTAAVVSAGLDVDFTNKGLLIPRVALTSTTDAATVAAPATSLMVYNTATAGVAPNNVTPGHYYWDGAKWVRQISFAIERWVYPPTNINAGTTYTLTAVVPGCTSASTATVNLYGDWGAAPQVIIQHVEARTGQVRFKVQNISAPATNYLGMDFIITVVR